MTVKSNHFVFPIKKMFFVYLYYIRTIKCRNNNHSGISSIVRTYLYHSIEYSGDFSESQ